MRPMLAATCKDVKALRYPLYGSVKLDGIRALVIHGVVLSRTMKPIPNPQVQGYFEKYEGCDGELIVGNPAAKDCYRKTVSHCMSQAAPVNDLYFLCFDFISYGNEPFRDRLLRIPPKVRLEQVLFQDAEALAEYEHAMVKAGHEGIVTRDPSGIYKNGRSTLNEQGMVKVKRFSDSEARVVKCEELMHNDNEATTNALGYTERTSHKANQKPMGLLGALVVEWKGMIFKIGTGFTAADRWEMWRNQPLGRTVKFKYLAVGMKDAPRHPVFLGFRDD